MQHLMVVVGEASGDLLAAEVVAELQKTYPHVVLSGVGGEALQARGLQSLVPLQDVSVMGLAGILSSIRRIYNIVCQVVRAAQHTPPDVLLVVDSLDFTHAIAKRVRKLLPNTRIVRYAAPKVWAWRPYRAHKLRGVYHAMAALFPFEPQFFARYGVQATFTGHPVVQRVAPVPAAAPDAPLLLLAGSRRSEVQRLLPIFLQTAKMLNVPTVIPTLPHLVPLVQQYQQQAGTHYAVVTQSRFEVMAQGRAALAASGTVVLELAAANIPTVAAYKVDALSAWLAKKLICVPYVTLPNILLNKPLVPELLQNQCTPAALAQALTPLLHNNAARAQQIQGFTQCMALLGRDDPHTPAARAAACVLNQPLV